MKYHARNNAACAAWSKRKYISQERQHLPSYRCLCVACKAWHTQANVVLNNTLQLLQGYIHNMPLSSYNDVGAVEEARTRQAKMLPAATPSHTQRPCGTCCATLWCVYLLPPPPLLQTPSPGMHDALYNTPPLATRQDRKTNKGRPRHNKEQREGPHWSTPSFLQTHHPIAHQPTRVKRKPLLCGVVGVVYSGAALAVAARHPPANHQTMLLDATGDLNDHRRAEPLKPWAPLLQVC